MCTATRLRLLTVTLLATSIFVPWNLRAEGAGNTMIMAVAEPIIAGNVVLPPGIYSWKLVDSSSSINIVRITNQNTGRVEATIFGIPNFRPLPSETHELDFWETPKGLPRAVHAWFRPGESSGQEFAYPAKLLATLVRNPPQQLPGFDRVSVAAATHEPRILAAAKAHVLPHSAEHPSRQHPEGSWAIITNGVTSKPANQNRWVWASIKRWPIAVTVLPLIGLAGVISLFCYLLTHSKSANGVHT